MRIFFEENIAQDSMELSLVTAKHVSQVLRMQERDRLLLTDGKGTKAIVEISELNKKTCSVNVVNSQNVENPNPDISLAISFTKNNNRMEWLLEKITEIGVRNIYPIITKRSERKEIKLERFQKKMISAMLQSQQYFLPILHKELAFSNLLNLDFDTKLIAHCDTNLQREPLIMDSKLKTNNSKLIIIGPEGDFTTEEIQQALQQNFKSITLGKNRLRTETAGLVAVTLLNHYAQ